MNGSVFATSVDGIEYIKFTGTVRYSHCGGLETHIDLLLSDKSTNEIVIDLEEAEILDSTALGLLARIAIEQKKLHHTRPVIFLKEGELNNILKRVCFDRVFELVHSTEFRLKSELEELVSQPKSEEAVLQRVIKAHQNLALLSSKNAQLYRDITNALGSR